MWRLRSLRARLVAGLLAVATVGVLVLGFGTYRALGGFLQSRTDQQLRDSQVPVYRDLALADFPGHGPTGDSVILTGTYAELRHPDGPLARYVTRGRIPPDLADERDGGQAPVRERFYTAPAESGGGSYRVLTTPLDDGSVFSVALPLDDDQATLRRLVGIEVGTSAGVLAALAAMGWWVVRLGLRPLDQIGATAAAIAAGDLGRRVEQADERTEVGRLGLALNRMLGQIESAFEERRATEDRLRRFVADASHELRTPVAVVKTEIEAALRSGDYGPRAREALVAALEECDSLAQLAEDLLVIVRAAEGQLPVREEQLGLRSALEAVRERFADRAAERGRHIRVDAPDGLLVQADPLRLRQALGNLIDNALRHGEGDVALRARRAEDGIEIEVADQGTGFAPALGDGAFERFTRGDQARTRGGAGLGMAIVRAIAEAHGGRTAIAPGPGGVVHIWLPGPPG